MSSQNRLSLMYLSGLVGIVVVIVGVIALLSAMFVSPSAWNITFWCGSISTIAFALAAIVDPTKQYLKKPGAVSWLFMSLALFVVSYLFLYKQ
jgi:multisubunit Na+/H+ antiporter MnhB subunit